MAQGPHGVRSEAHRPVAVGRNGMVCAGHPLAAEAGIAVLRQGGTAADAALAVAAALNVVEPNMSGMGGDGFIMVYDRVKGLRVMNATGPAPHGATLEKYQSGGIPMKGIRSVSVPGLVAGWLEVHSTFGRLALKSVLAPAVDLAESGFPISLKLARGIADDPMLGKFSSSRAIFTRDGTPLGVGDLLVQRDLANSLRALSEGGADAFYRGVLAKGIVQCSEQNDGLLTLEDLAEYRPRWQDPISVRYRDYVVYEAPPNSSGHILLQMLNLIEPYDVAAWGTNSADSIHVMVEAKKLAFADREAYVADPDFVDVPIDGLLSKEYADARRRHIDLQQARDEVPAGDPWPFEGRQPRKRRRTGPEREDTTCFVVVDRWGNAVCQLQSIQSSFGSALVAPGTGILLNNRMTYWHLDPSHVDCLVPGKRVRHTMNPVMVFRGDDLYLACGTPGADTQVQTNLQLITHIVDDGYSVVEAVEAPRWRHLQNNTESTVPHTCTDELLLESRFAGDVSDALRRRGHAVRTIGEWEATGSAMAIHRDPRSGALFGGADPRRDGYAIGW